MERAVCSLLTWSDVTEIINSGQLERLGRSLEQQISYLTFIEEIKRGYASVSDYILISKFSLRSNIIDGKCTAVRETTQEVQTILLSNDFPYYFEDGIIHYIYWKLGGDVIDSEVNLAASKLMTSVVGAMDYITYVNPPNLKSIPEISHAHILMRIGK